MEKIKSILFLGIIFALFTLSSCGKKTTKVTSRDPVFPTQELVFCANAMYDSKEDIPDIILAYCCYEKVYNDDVKLEVCLGQSYALMYDDYETYEYLNEEPLFDTKNNDYKIYVVDENNNKNEYIMDIRPNHQLIFLNTNDKNTLYTWSIRINTKISIPKECFAKDKGEVFLSAFEESKTTTEEKSLVMISIKYTKDENGIRLIAPENSIFERENSGRQ